jgi:molybdenum cofactor cytidylyltransferase
LTPRIGCIVLAAGAGRRFERGAAKRSAPGRAGSRPSKLVALLGRDPLLQRAIDAACGSSASTCTLVLGAHAGSVLAGVDARRCGIAFNDQWRAGIASSIRFGLRAHRDDDACVIMLGDQPFVTSADLDQMMGAGSEIAVVALRAAGVWGAPVLFPRRDFAALARLKGDRGAKRYAAAQKQRLVFVDALDLDAFDDVDTPVDLTRLNERGIRRTRR